MPIPTDAHYPSPDGATQAYAVVCKGFEDPDFDGVCIVVTDKQRAEELACLCYVEDARGDVEGDESIDFYDALSAYIAGAGGAEYRVVDTEILS